MKVIQLSGEWKLFPYKYRELTPGEIPDMSKPLGESLNAMVPGDIHMDLQNANRIQDPFYADNALSCGWVTEQDWCYVREFELGREELFPHMMLELDSVDTYSIVVLNGKLVGCTENMFLPYAFDVSGAVMAGKNTLAIYIRSIKQIMKKFPEDRYLACFNEQRLFIRKAQCHFSWDWAPNFPGAGICGDVRLAGFAESRLGAIQFITRCDGSVTVHYELENYRRDSQTARRLQLAVEGFMPVQQVIDSKSGHFNMTIENPKLWWPADMGGQPMYSYTMQYTENGVVADEKSGRFGIREITVDERPRENEDGLRFCINVNGKPAFLKGANWVPLDLRTGTIPDEKYSRILELLHRANGNCLRVWGGGIFERDIFYDLCDSMGILIWQDFMLSCSDIPTETEFIQALTAETEVQVKRLRNHPSIFLWCGCNERSGSLDYDRATVGENVLKYLLRGIAGHLDSTRPYAYCSPHGFGDLDNELLSGDSHVNSFLDSTRSFGQENFRQYLATLKTSMATEIAAMGCVPMESLSKFIPQDKLWPINDIWDLHFACNPYDGSGLTFTGQQQQSVERLFGKAETLHDFVKKSMAMQCLFVKADAEYHRSRKGACSGALFWMYNDIWPCGTWALVDYYLLPKPAYYAAKRAFRPFTPIIARHEEGVGVFMVNDTLEERHGTIVLEVRDFEGRLRYEQKIGGTTVPACCSLRVGNLSDDQLADADTYAVVRYTDEKGDVSNLYRDGLWKYATLPQPHLQWRVIAQTDRAVTIEISTENYARMVFIHCRDQQDYLYSDNYFDMEPQTIRQIVIEGPACPDGITVQSWTDEWNY